MRRPILAEVPQGSLLGPVLCSVYINDTQSIQNGNKVAISLRADYTSVTICSGSMQLATSKVNSVASLLEPWIEKLRVNINISKLSITVFSERCSHYSINKIPSYTH